MSKNKKIVFIVVGIIVLVGVFFIGMSFGKSQTTAGGANRTGQFSGMNRNNRTAGGGFVSGQIISKDANSITVQIMNGDPTATNTSTGSKIIFLDTSTAISKMATGSLNDLATGTEVSVTGTTNADGSITAKSIQIRPQIKPGMPAQQ